MVDSTLNCTDECSDCGNNLTTEPFEPRRCGPCSEVEARRVWRRICANCRGHGVLVDTLNLQDGRSVKVERVCEKCGGDGETIWPR